MKKDNTRSHSTICLSTAFLLLGCNGTKQPDNQKPNILFIVADDLGWSDLGCYGADFHETPNIDKLAKKSARFLNGYAAAPVCSPTRASLMTGKYPARLHYTIWSEAASVSERKNQEVYRFLPPQTLESLPLEAVTVAEELKKSGYLTAHIGKWHLGDLMHFPQTQGFDVSIAASQRGAPPTFFYPYKGVAFGEYRFITDLGTSAEGTYFKDRKGEYLTDRLTDEAMKIIGDAGDRPFYLNLWYYNVHTPLEAKASDVAWFKNRLSPSFHHQNETYAAMVKSVDDNVGKLLKKLDELDIAKNTVVIFISDNGGYINEYKNKRVTSNFPLRSGKGSLYEGGIRIPALIFDPRTQVRGEIIDTPISTIDFFPTMMELTGTRSEVATDGISILPLLKGIRDTNLENRILYWHYPHYYPTTTPVSAIRDGDWKLIEFLEDGHTELYNLADDIGENHNLAKEEPQVTKALQEKLHKWKENTGAQGIVPNPNFQSN